MSVNLGTATGYLELNSDRWVSSYNTARQQMQALADSSQSMSSRFQAAGQMLTSAGTALTTCVTVPLAGMGAASLKSAVDFESAFAGVRKTVDATKSQYKDLEDGIRSMSKQMPQSAAEIATVAESAGQLGIQRENVLSFTKVMVELGDTTNLSSEEAASALAQFANVTGMSMDNIDRLGSTIVALGNNLATTESAIVEMGQRMASTGSQIGMTEAQIMSWSGAMSSVGVSAEVGGSSFSKFAKDVQLAVETNSSQLSKFAKVAGMSSSEFSKAFKEDASGALQAFIKGLSESEEKGTSVTAVLDALGYTEVGMSQTLSSLAGGYGTLSKALDVGSESWKENTALSKEAETRYQTTESQLEILKNQFQDVGISIGQILLPTLQSLMSALSSFASYLASLDEGTLRIITTIGMVAASIGPVLLILGSLASAIGNLIELKALLAESSILSSAIGRVSGLFTSLRNVIMGSVVPALQSLWAFMLTNPITFVIAAIAALVAGFVYLWNNCESFRNFWINLWDNIVSTVSKIPGQVQKIFNELPGKISGALDSTGDALINWGYSISGGVGDTMTDLYGVFRDSFDGMVEYIKNITTIVKDIFTGNWGAIPGDVEKLFTGMCNSVGNILSGLANIVGDAFAMVNDAIQAVLGKIWGGVIDWASNINSGLGQAFLNAYYTISDTFDGIMTVIRDVTTIISDIFRGDWSSAVNHLKTLWNDLLFYAKMIFGDIVESIKGFIVGAKDFAVDALSNIGQWFNELPGKIGTALGTALGTIASWIVNTWNYFTTNIPKWIESIGQWFSELPGKIGTWLTNTYNNVISWGSNMLSKAIETGTNFVNNVVNFIKNLPTTVYNWLTQTYNKVVNWATQMGNKARETGSTFVSKVGSTIQSLPGQVWSYLSQTISKASAFVSQFGQKATQAARSFTTNIVNGVRGIPNQMLSIGRSIVQGIWNGISGMGSWLRSQISNFASGVVKGFKAGFKINSPSKIMRDVIGKGIVEGIGVGIDQEEDSLLTKAYKLAGNVVNVMDGNIATANLFDTAKNLTTSMNIATNQATGQDSRANNINVAFNINNPTFSDKIDIESFMDEASFYLKRKMKGNLQW